MLFHYKIFNVGCKNDLNSQQSVEHLRGFIVINID